jgi:tetratricopeptide (TPR) repeat protein
MTDFSTPGANTTPVADSQRDQDLALVMQAALEHHRAKEYDKAAALYGLVLDTVGQHLDARYHLGVLLMETGRAAEAVPHFEAALGQAPGNAQVWIGYVNAYIGSEQPDAARLALDLAVQHGLPQGEADALTKRIAQGTPAPMAAPTSSLAPVKAEKPRMKLIGFTMVRNEEDIIEQFVRHNLQHFDKLYVFDHGSIDCTEAILKALGAEGLAVIPVHGNFDAMVGYAQSEIMTTLFRYAVQENGAAIYFPIDADEFLHPKQDMNAFREVVENSSSSLFPIPWLNMPILPGFDDAAFADVPKSLPQLECWSTPEHRYSKVAVKITDVNMAKRMTISQGSHNLYIDREMVEKDTRHDLLRYIHVPVRSAKQAFTKVVCGWLSNVQRFGVNTNIAWHWQRAFNLICDDGYGPANRELAELLSDFYAEHSPGSTYETLDASPLFTYRLAYADKRKEGFGVILKNIESDFLKAFAKRVQAQAAN